MLHIAYCEHEECPKKLECFRYMCLEEDRASIIDFKHICGELNEYERFYEIGDKKVREIKEEIPELKEGEESECAKMSNSES